MKQELLDNWDAQSKARDVTTNAALTRLYEVANKLRMADDEDGLYTELLAQEAVAGIALRDAENDQREIANLLWVADSHMFSDAVRTRAVERIEIMLELR